MTNDLISKQKLLSVLKNYNDCGMPFTFEDLINSAPVVKSIEHDAPSEPIEGGQSVKLPPADANFDAFGDISFKDGRTFFMGELWTRETLEKAIIPSTQAPKE